MMSRVWGHKIIVDETMVDEMEISVWEERMESHNFTSLWEHTEISSLSPSVNKASLICFTKNC